MEAKKGAISYEKKGRFLSGVVADFMDKRFSCDVGSWCRDIFHEASYQSSRGRLLTAFNSFVGKD